MELHDRAAAGFSRTAEAYEHGRPGYPPEVIELLRRECGLRPGRTALDLAAGTGKLTRLLVPTGAELIAVEPVAQMRAELARSLPGVTLLEGTAEAIPLPAGAVDAVLVAQAFHWFRGEQALAEIHRVLRPDGRLAIVWNVADISIDWLARVAGIIDRHVGDTPQYRTGRWRDAFATTALFTPPAERSFRHPQAVPQDAFLARQASISYIGALPAAEHGRVLDEIRRVLDAHPATAGQRLLRFDYRTDVYWCRRLAPRAQPS